MNSQTDKANMIKKTAEDYNIAMPKKSEATTRLPSEKEIETKPADRNTRRMRFDVV